jgi:amidase
MDLHFETLLEVSKRLRRGEITAEELTRSMLERIDRVDSQLRSYATVTAELALQQAKEADVELRAGRARGRLHGVPIALKDLCATFGAPTHAGGPAVANWNPDGEATVARRLREAGAVLLGKLQTTEGAYAFHHPSINPPVNPWNPDYWTGVSSSGSGAATAGGLCFASLGSDTGGSIRFPSHCCGDVGLKPTWGRVSRHDVFPLSESLDHVGPITRSVEDAAAVLEIIAGSDPADPTTLPAPVPNYVAELERGVRGIRVGLDRAYCSEDVDPRTTAAIFGAAEILRDRGAEIVPVAMPDASEANAKWGILCAADAAAAHTGFFPERRDRYGPGLAAFLDAGLAARAVDYVEAYTLRERYAGAVADLFQGVDLVLSPSSHDTTPTNAAIEAALSGGDVTRLIDFTAPADLSRSPAICLPAGFDEAGAPYGFQIVGRHLSEDLLCRAGYAYQMDTDWSVQHPAL